MTEYCNGNTVSFDELDREHGNNSLKAIEILQNNIKKFNDTALYDIGEVNFYQPCIEKLKQVFLRKFYYAFVTLHLISGVMESSLVLVISPPLLKKGNGT